MKKQNLLKSLALGLFAVSALTLSSCSNDDGPADPHNEHGDHDHDHDHGGDDGHDHDEWQKVTFTFHRGHLHGSTFHSAPENEKVKYFKPVQEVSYAYDDEGNLTATGDTTIRFIEGEIFSLEMNYYDHDGDRINGEFTTADASPIHQHFFLTKDATVINSDTPFNNPETILDYRYRDTTPWDGMIKEDGVELRDPKDPIGLKGYFFVNKAYAEFDLNAILVHITKGDKFDSEGNPYPFNAPSSSFLSTQDLNIKLPVRVYTARPGDSEDSFITFIQDMANEYNVTYEAAEADWEEAVSTSFDNSNYWM